MDYKKLKDKFSSALKKETPESLKEFVRDINNPHHKTTTTFTRDELETYYFDSYHVCPSGEWTEKLKAFLDTHPDAKEFHIEAVGGGE